METMIALVAFSILVLAWAVLPVRKTDEAATTASLDKMIQTEVEDKSRQLVAASGSVAR